MKVAHFLTALLTLLSTVSYAGEKQQPISLNLLDSIIATTPVTPIEGVWQFLPDNASIAIIRQPGTLTATGPTGFNIYLYSTVSSRLIPGTLIGTLAATPQPNTYLAEMWLNPSGKSGKNKKFIIKLTNTTHISFTSLKNGMTIDLWRLIPYLYRVSVKRNKASEELNGCVKIKPLTPGVSQPVRYL